MNLVDAVETVNTGVGGDWLDARLEREGVPPELSAAVRRCASGDPEGDLATRLATCALRELDRVGDDPATREAAVRLLAADALLTLAFEAAAEHGHDVERFADRFGVRGALGERMRRARVPAVGTSGPASREGAEGEPDS